MDDNMLWFLGAYIVGTGFGWFLGKTSSIKEVAGLTIDHLIEGGYLKYRRDKDGEIELVKLEEEQ